MILYLDRLSRYWRSLPAGPVPCVFDKQGRAKERSGGAAKGGTETTEFRQSRECVERSKVSKVSNLSKERARGKGLRIDILARGQRRLDNTDPSNLYYYGYYYRLILLCKRLI